MVVMWTCEQCSVLEGLARVKIKIDVRMKSFCLAQAQSLLDDRLGHLLRTQISVFSCEDSCRLSNVHPSIRHLN